MPRRVPDEARVDLLAKDHQRWRLPQIKDQRLLGDRDLPVAQVPDEFVILVHLYQREGHRLGAVLLVASRRLHHRPEDDELLLQHLLLVALDSLLAFLAAGTLQDQRILAERIGNGMLLGERDARGPAIDALARRRLTVRWIFINIKYIQSHAAPSCFLVRLLGL